jgi:hypothetical protein
VQAAGKSQALAAQADEVKAVTEVENLLGR